MANISPPEFDELAAREALDALVEKISAPYPASVMALDPRPLNEGMRALLNQDLPLACYAPSTENPDGVYVPAWVIEYAAGRIFGDRWSSDVVHVEVMQDSKDGVRFDGATRGMPEKPVHRLVVRAQVKITVRSPQGQEQSHTGLGVATHDVEWGSQQIHTHYKLALKGAVTDARRTALSYFGRLLNPKGSDRDLAFEALVRGDTDMAKPPARLAKTRARKAGLRAAEQWTLLDADGQTLESYPKTLLGAQNFLNDLAEMLEQQEDPEAMAALRRENASLLANLRKEFGKDAKDALKAFEKRADQATAALAGFGEPRPAKAPVVVSEDSQADDQGMSAEELASLEASAQLQEAEYDLDDPALTMGLPEDPQVSGANDFPGNDQASIVADAEVVELPKEEANKDVLKESEALILTEASPSDEPLPTTPVMEFPENGREMMEFLLNHIQSATSAADVQRVLDQATPLMKPRGLGGKDIMKISEHAAARRQELKG